MDKERVAKIKKSNVAVTSSPAKGSSKGGDHEAEKSPSPSNNNNSTGASDNDESSDAMDTTTPCVNNANL